MLTLFQYLSLPTPGKEVASTVLTGSLPIPLPSHTPIKAHLTACFLDSSLYPTSISLSLSSGKPPYCAFAKLQRKEAGRAGMLSPKSLPAIHYPPSFSSRRDLIVSLKSLSAKGQILSLSSSKDLVLSLKSLPAKSHSLGLSP